MKVIPNNWCTAALSNVVTFKSGGISPPFTLRPMKKQWGSCSPKGRLSLNPALIKAPRDCIEYVLIHELCHIKEHNHSKQFYAHLDHLMPNWRAVKTKLDAMAEMLLEG